MPSLIFLSFLTGCAGDSNTVHTHEKDGYYELHVPVSKLILTIPQDGLIKKNVKIGGGTDNPRYFYFENGSKKLIISGWFEPAQNYPGINKYWEDKVINWRRMGLQPPKDVYFKKVYGWNSIFYNDQLPDYTVSHISANWIQAGTWIDLHISITSNYPNDEVRSKLVKIIDSIQVLEKE
jgi:phage terminase large subunit-like protein